MALLHKPAGILVSGNRFKTITNALPQNIKKSSQKDATKPQPIHRLDYATTGILLVGKTGESIRLLNKLFVDKAIIKTYYAVTIGTMEDSGKIISPIDGKKSQTEFVVLKSVNSKRFNKLNLVRLTPLTGRRHQLRKHLASIGHPILGDATYGEENLILKGKGLYLHAYSLRFKHPYTKKEVHLIDELPKGFLKIFPVVEDY